MEFIFPHARTNCYGDLGQDFYFPENNMRAVLFCRTDGRNNCDAMRSEINSICLIVFFWRGNAQSYGGEVNNLTDKTDN